MEIRALGHDGTTFTLEFTAQAGQSYTLQYRDSLTEGDWLKLMDIPAPLGTAERISIPDAPANLASRFYRLVSPSQP